MVFIYHNNRNQDWLDPKHPGMVMFVWEADSIIEADKMFKVQTGLDPDKNPWIGREIRP